MSGRGRICGLFAAAVALLVVALAPSPALAVSPEQKQKAAIISVAARHALDKGDFEVAAKLYDDAYAADPEVSGYLYSAARARQRGGQLQRAREIYERFLQVTKGKNDPLDKRAKARLVEVKAELADRLAKQLHNERRAREKMQEQARQEAEQRRRRSAMKAAAQAEKERQRRREQAALTFAVYRIVHAEGGKPVAAVSPRPGGASFMLRF